MRYACGPTPGNLLDWASHHVIAMSPYVILGGVGLIVFGVLSAAIGLPILDRLATWWFGDDDAEDTAASDFFAWRTDDSPGG